MGETFRHPVVELAAPPWDLKRIDEPLLVLRKGRAVATGTAAIPTPDPTPECWANRANRKDTSTYAEIANPSKSLIYLNPTLKGPGSYATV